MSPHCVECQRHQARLTALGSVPQWRRDADYVREHCDPLLRQRYDAEYMEQETDLPAIVGFMFLEAAEEFDTKLLAQAGKAVDDFIQKEGSTILGLLKDLGIPVEYKDVFDTNGTPIVW